ncbi:type I methionyl aminopeptidase [Atopobiaceae bacterium SGI.236]|nr:type I methionyl aminopeptidase [Atopobiaceae bacterium]
MIKIKSARQIEEMKSAGALSKTALRRVGEAVVPGVTTLELDAIAERVIRSAGATPTFKGYCGFPGTICASVNDQIVHGIPSSSVVLRDGDIVSVDVGATFGGWVGDNAWTFYCGEPTREAQVLCEVTRDCLKAAIRQAVPGNRLGDVGDAVQRLAEKHGFGVVRDYTGHGVGHDMHEEPNVPNYGKRGRGVRLQSGMVIAIEPMITLGNQANDVAGNGWTVSTLDGSLAAHYENTVAITDDGPVVLTADEAGPWCESQGGRR